MVRKEDPKKELIAVVPKQYHKKLEKVVAIAERNYSDIRRLSGEPLLNHVLRSAKYYAELKIDFNGIVATVLHHRLPEKEYRDTTIFNPDVLGLLENLEKVFLMAKQENVDAQIIYKYLLSFQDDIRIVLIKLSEKFDNARTIDLLPIEKRIDVARRLLSIYVPLAKYLNLNDARYEFELNGFRVYYPEEYQDIASYMHEHQADLNTRIVAIRTLLQEIAGIVQVDASIWGRTKSFYSIWKKMQKYGKEGKRPEILGMNDLIAFTVMVDSVDQCYSFGYALKDYAIKDTVIWEDYVSNPKPNGFSEIQIVCAFQEYPNVRFEVQVLTPEMYWGNTYGPASHYAYKIQGTRFAKSSTEYQWVEQVHTELEKTRQSVDIPESRPLKMGLFSDRIYTFTPEHKIIELPQKATVIDFAYHVHSDIGNKAVRARVNGKNKTLDTILENGDIVEIIIDQGKKYPSENWLRVAVTKLAQSKIKAGLRHRFID